MLADPRIAAVVTKSLDATIAKLGMTLEGHLQELETLRDMAKTGGKFAAAIMAEIARGKASGVHVEKTEVTGANGGPIAAVTAIMSAAKFEQIAKKIADEV